MIANFRKYIAKYAHLILWVLAGYINIYLGMITVVITFLALIQKERLVQLLASLWILFAFSDSIFIPLEFAKEVKPSIMVICGLAIFMGKIKITGKNKFIFPFLPFFAYSAVTSLFSVVAYTSYQKLISYAFLFIVVSSLVTQIAIDKKQNEMYKDLIYLGVSFLVIGLLVNVTNTEDLISYEGRFNGIFRNPNGLGLFSAIFLMMSTLFFSMSDIFSKRAKRIVLLTIVFSLVMSGSRTSMGSTVLFYIGGTMSAFSPWYFVVFSTIMGFFFNDLYDWVISLVEKFGLEEEFRLKNIGYASGRIYIWEAAWMEITENFFFTGGGFDYTEGHYDVWKPKYEIIIPDLKYHLGNIHQSFLTIWMNTGLFGLCMFCYGWIQKVLDALGKSKLTLPIVVGLVFSASYESWLVASMNPFTIQVVIMFTMIIYYEKPKEQIPTKGFLPVNKYEKKKLIVGRG